jgi:hypothetical protein
MSLSLASPHHPRPRVTQQPWAACKFCIPVDDVDAAHARMLNRNPSSDSDVHLTTDSRKKVLPSAHRTEKLIMRASI